MRGAIPHRVWVARIVGEIVERSVGDGRVGKGEALKAAETEERGDAAIAQLAQAGQVERSEAGAAGNGGGEASVPHLSPGEVKCRQRQRAEEAKALVVDEAASGQTNRAQGGHVRERVERLVGEPLARVGQVNGLYAPARVHKRIHVGAARRTLVSLEQRSHLLPHRLGEVRR